MAGGDDAWLEAKNAAGRATMTASRLERVLASGHGSIAERIGYKLGRDIDIGMKKLLKYQASKIIEYRMLNFRNQGCSGLGTQLRLVGIDQLRLAR
jgi:hypothetical protein